MAAPSVSFWIGRSFNQCHGGCFGSWYRSCAGRFGVTLSVSQWCPGWGPRRFGRCSGAMLGVSVVVLSGRVPVGAVSREPLIEIAAWGLSLALILKKVFEAPRFKSRMSGLQGRRTFQGDVHLVVTATPCARSQGPIPTLLTPPCPGRCMTSWTGPPLYRACCIVAS